MTVVGEEPSYGDHHRARAVHDVDLFELLEVVQKLASGRDMAGVELNGTPKFCVGSTVNAGASGGALELELGAMEKKMALGAEFFVTPPVFDLQPIARFMKRVSDRNPRIIPTVLLLKSVGMARYIDRHLEHVQIPADIVRQIQLAPDKIRECIRIAAELVSAIKNAGYSGVLISTKGWEDKLPNILEV
jgi:5,10-methylenetetrahydrofolate reductase